MIRLTGRSLVINQEHNSLFVSKFAEFRLISTEINNTYKWFSWSGHQCCGHTHKVDDGEMFLNHSK